MLCDDFDPREDSKDRSRLLNRWRVPLAIAGGGLILAVYTILVLSLSHVTSSPTTVELPPSAEAVPDETSSPDTGRLYGMGNKLPDSSLSAAVPEVERQDFDLRPTECLRSKSLRGEEETVRKFLGWETKMDGTYVEIGALDGSRFSNTASLATCQRWGGVLVEGSKTNFQNLVRNVKHQKRPKLTAFNGAVCAPPQQTVQFIASGNGAVGGDVESMGKDFVARWHKDFLTKDISVPVACKPMEFYLSGLTHVDFFSLDVEGAELVVLETIDFNAVTIDVFIIESNGKQPEKNWKVRKFMANLGYSKCKPQLVPGISGSDLFIREKAYPGKC